jgi:hypothetical protein
MRNRLSITSDGNHWDYSRHAARLHLYPMMQAVNRPGTIDIKTYSGSSDATTKSEQKLSF